MFTCTLRHSFADLSAEERRHLAPGGHSIFLDPDWFALLAKHILEPHQQLRLYVVTKQGDPLPSLVLPCIAQRQRKGLFSWSQLTSLTNFYSMDFGPMVAADCEAGAYAALFDYIAHEKPGWAELDFRMLPAHQDSAQQFVQACQATFPHSYLFFQYDNWTIDVRGQSAEDYLAARPSRLKNTYKRRRNKLEKEKGYTIRTYTGGPDLEKGINDYFEIYNASWKGSEYSRPCMEDFMQMLAKKDILRLGILYIGDEPVASFFLFIHANGEALIYKLAYKEGFNDYSPGTILTVHMLEQALLHDNITLIDYGIGPEKYKLDWMETNLKREGLIAHNNKLLSGKLLILSDNTIRTIKKIS